MSTVPYILRSHFAPVAPFWHLGGQHIHIRVSIGSDFLEAARGKAIEMEDVKFHQCVRLSRFENDRTVSFAQHACGRADRLPRRYRSFHQTVSLS